MKLKCILIKNNFKLLLKGMWLWSVLGVACQTSLSQLGNAIPSSMAKTFLHDVLFFFGKSNDTSQLEFRYTTPRITGLVSEGSVRVYPPGKNPYSELRSLAFSERRTIKKYWVKGITVYVSMFCCITTWNIGNNFIHKEENTFRLLLILILCEHHYFNFHC